ncbi:MAG TPA: BamA/TamA family outer membrane protein [Vicinamibacterales bacterium]|nr:BamA/TamA family outer membrane protein [Vicinamibacterales bacterium]
MSTTLRNVLILLATLVTITAPAYAQESDADNAGYQLPRGWISSPIPGFLREPSILSKLAMATDTSLGGEPRDGFYVETGNMITGEGWISGGPGFRQSLLDGRARIDMSAALSWNLYKVARASFELPHLAHDRLSVGVEGRYQDALQVRFFGVGNDSLKADESAYRFNNVDLLASGRLRVNRWLSLDGRVGWIPRPDLSNAAGPRVSVPNTEDLFSEATAPGISAQPSYIHSDVSAIADSRDHAGHPTSGGLYRATAAVYSDRDGGAYSFRRYELEATQYVPLGTRKWVLALHGWGVLSDTSSGAAVPFYLMPSLGGKNTLRGYFSYRFHDNDLQSFNVESRWPLLTHMDVAVFADEGKVAHTVSEVNFLDARMSYGAGVRFHNATSTLLRIDAGHSVEGWRLYFVLSDALKRSTPASGRSSVVPFVP